MPSTRIITGLILVAAIVGVLGLAAFMLWLSGDWRWVEGWIFGVWWVGFVAALLLWLRSRDPALLAERMRMPGSGGESRSDVVILIGIELVLPGLDRCAAAGCALRLDTPSTAVVRSMRRHSAARG